MPPQNRLTVKLFIGFLLTSELRMHHKQSLKTKNVLAHGLDQVRYRSKEYLGFYLPHENIPLAELKKIQEEVQKRLSIQCPTLQKEYLNIFIFPQLFVA